MKTALDTKRSEWRTAQEAFEDAKFMLTGAERDLAKNKDKEAKQGLLAAVQAAEAALKTAESAKFEKENIFYKYQSEYELVNGARKEELAERAKVEREGRETALKANEAEREAFLQGAYKTFMDTKTTLKAAVTEAEANGTSDEK